MAATPNAPAKEPEAPSAAPEQPPATTCTSGESMLRGESHEWQDSDGEALFTEPPNKKAKVMYAMLKLKPPDFEIPEFGGGSHRKRHPSELKLRAIEHAQSVVEGGKGTGGTVGLRYATMALVISDKAMPASWLKYRSTYGKEEQQATLVSGTNGKTEAMKNVFGERREGASSPDARLRRLSLATDLSISCSSLSPPHLTLRSGHGFPRHQARRPPLAGAPVLGATLAQWV